MSFLPLLFNLVEKLHWESRLWLRVGHVCQLDFIFRVEGLDLFEDLQRIVLDGPRERLDQMLLIHHLYDEVEVLCSFLLLFFYNILLVVILLHQRVVLFLHLALLFVFFHFGLFGRCGSSLCFPLSLGFLLPLLFLPFSLLFDAVGPEILKIIFIDVLYHHLNFLIMLEVVENLLEQRVCDVLNISLELFAVVNASSRIALEVLEFILFRLKFLVQVFFDLRARRFLKHLFVIMIVFFVDLRSRIVQLGW